MVESDDADEREDVDDAVDALGTESKSLGIPHSVHVLRAAGESPGGLRFPQIVHSQLDQSSSVLSVDDCSLVLSADGVVLPIGVGVGDVTLTLEGLVLSFDDAKYSVIFGEDLKNPA